jgi:hypothetical protein
MVSDLNLGHARLPPPCPTASLARHCLGHPGVELKMLTKFGFTVALYLLKILSCSRNFLGLNLIIKPSA